jgi:hypothetical protein
VIAAVGSAWTADGDSEVTLGGSAVGVVDEPDVDTEPAANCSLDPAVR